MYLKYIQLKLTIITFGVIGHRARFGAYGRSAGAERRMATFSRFAARLV
jgi:hypothetical protein